MTETVYTDGTYLKKNTDWHADDSPWKTSQIQKIFQRNNLSPTTICEVGCGAGEIIKQLKEKSGDHVKATGYEISPQAFEICKNKAVDGLNYKLENLLEDETSYYDVALAIDVFEHVEDYIGFIRAFRDRGNFKVFHIPLDLSAQAVARAKPLKNARDSVGHLHYFTKDTALATLDHAGYEIVDYFYTNGSLDLPNRGWKAHLASIPRRAMFAINKDFGVRLLGGCSLMVLAK